MEQLIKTFSFKPSELNKLLVDTNALICGGSVLFCYLRENNLISKDETWTNELGSMDLDIWVPTNYDGNNDSDNEDNSDGSDNEDNSDESDSEDNPDNEDGIETSSKHKLNTEIYQKYLLGCDYKRQFNGSKKSDGAYNYGSGVIKKDWRFKGLILKVETYVNKLNDKKVQIIHTNGTKDNLNKIF
jgi:hypothetical protein